MNHLEREVWATAFAAEFARERKFKMEHGGGTVEDISGFSCAEIADSAVERLREALSGDDAEYLLPVSEGEGGGRDGRQDEQAQVNTPSSPSPQSAETGEDDAMPTGIPTNVKHTELLGELTTAYMAMDVNGDPWIILRREGSGADRNSRRHGYGTPRYGEFRVGRQYWFAYRETADSSRRASFGNCLGGTLSTEGSPGDYCYGRLLFLKTRNDLGTRREQEWAEETPHGFQETRREVVESIVAKTGGLGKLFRFRVGRRGKK
jgi:hypothetical protein